MKISIDSTEPLEDVLRVVGAVYGVTLAVATENPERTQAAGPERSPRRRPAKRRASAPKRGARRGSANGRSTVGQAQIRSWARENGHTVSDRGRLPAAVLAAYRDAN